jgi:predicted RNA-binding Zn ribbon-like protein
VSPWPIAFLFFFYPYTHNFTSPGRLPVNLDQAYIRKIRPRAQAEIDWFAHQPSLDAAIEKAALAVNSRGKRYSHQRRLKKAALKEALRNLLDESGAMEQASDFDDLFKLIGAAVNEHCAFQTRLLEKAKGLSAHL